MLCKTDKRHIGGLWQEKNRINLEPPYQRESGVWSKEKQQLFIDSVINKFDIPKFYFHDLRQENGPFLYSVIDGKQRLTTLWDFLENKFPLAPDFDFQVKGKEAPDCPPPQPSQYFKDFSDILKEYFKGRMVDIVEVEAADEDEIEDLFSRLNNGEPLNASEKRNAMGGEMVRLIREVAEHNFFKTKIGFPNRRASHLEVAAKFILLEKNYGDTKNHFCDLKKKHLDQLVNLNKSISEAEYKGLLKRVSQQLTKLEKIFDNKDQLLGKQSYPQLYYAWARQFELKYAVNGGPKAIHTFLENFATERITNNKRPDDQRDPVLVDFGRLSQQGTNDLGSMIDRSNILTKYFLLWNTSTEIKDKTRLFTDDERYVIWVTGGKKCANCGAELLDFKQMEADHLTAWKNGGPTTLDNAQCLCGTCNSAKGAS